MTDRPFSVLVVCTGNICRSPMGERLLAAGLRERFGDEAEQVSVTSAGTWGRDGVPDGALRREGTRWSSAPTPPVSPRAS